ncbi:hypothetical protein BLOT_016594 [Blomia tropicalis]|nr:hypothetical protein BLOT_016594 [Blomia tropicalis]
MKLATRFTASNDNLFWFTNNFIMSNKIYYVTLIRSKLTANVTDEMVQLFSFNVNLTQTQNSLSTYILQFEILNYCKTKFRMNKIIV